MRPHTGLTALLASLLVSFGVAACGGGGGNEGGLSAAVSTPSGNSTPSGASAGTGSPAGATATTGTGTSSVTATGTSTTGSGTSSAATSGSATISTGTSASAPAAGTSTTETSTAGAGPATGTGTTGTGTTGSSTTATAGGGAGSPGIARVGFVSAPADGATVNGTVQLALTGTNLGNAELLPATSPGPLLGRFNVASDGTSATLNFDSSTVPNGTLTVRIAAYNTPPSVPGATETPAMTPRTWRLFNQPPPVGNDAGRTARCQQMGMAATPPDSSNPVVCVTFAHTSTPTGQCTSFGTGYGNPEDALEVLRNGTRVSKLYCQPGANNGVLNSGCFCLS